MLASAPGIDSDVTASVATASVNTTAIAATAIINAMDAGVLDRDRDRMSGAGGT